MTDSEDSNLGASSGAKPSHHVIEVGVVKWFDEAKGFGFIEQSNGRDLFVHYTHCRGKLRQGDKVEYILGEGKKGPCATKVKVIESAG